MPAEGIGPLHALLLGIVEGLTEFLPVSSTGHLIAVNRWLGHADPRCEIAIQIGAISAIVVLYRARLLGALSDLRHAPGRNLLVLLAVAALPASVVGLFAGEVLDRLFTVPVVAVATMAGGLLLWILELWLQRRARHGEPPRRELERIGLRQAIAIGLMQCLALIPGTSRSGATIAGALLVGCTRPAAAEFSFLLGIPILYGACLLELLGSEAPRHGATGSELLLATGAAFVTALLVVKPFVRFLQQHTFVPFAIYRLLFGALLLWLWATGAFAGADFR